MKGLDANNLCSHGGDMLAYLYDEMAMPDRETFEVHLADCGTCIDDFAELSQSRYPVYEWKHTEFDPLPTPRVVIPFEAPAVSWFDQIRTVFSLRPTLAFGGIGAVMIVAVLTAYFMLGDSRTETQLAQEIRPAASPTRVVATMPPPSSSPVTTAESDEQVTPPESPKVVKASAGAKPAVRQPRSKPAQQPKRNEPVPVLSSIDDDEDDSLRLTDIFDEIGTSE